MTLPSPEEIVALHEKYAPKHRVPNPVWTHSRIVFRIALGLMQKAKVALNTDLVWAGCLVHDIGVYKLIKAKAAGSTESEAYIAHGVLGEQILKDEGFDETVQRFASHHTGVGITAEEIRRNHLPLPERDLLAETNEEKLVMYADKFHSKHGDSLVFNTYEWIEKHLAERFGEEKREILRELAAMFGVPDVHKLALMYKQKVREVAHA